MDGGCAIYRAAEISFVCLTIQIRSDLRRRCSCFCSGRHVSESEQRLFFSRRSLQRGESEMGHWIQARRGLSVVQLQIALLIFGVIAAGALLTYYVSSLPR